MSGLKIVPQSVSDILNLKAPASSFEAPNLQETFLVENGAEESEEAHWPREARQFVRKMQRKEARLRAKGRIA